MTQNHNIDPRLRARRNMVSRKNAARSVAAIAGVSAAVFSPLVVASGTGRGDTPLPRSQTADEKTFCAVKYDYAHPNTFTFTAETPGLDYAIYSIPGVEQGHDSACYSEGKLAVQAALEQGGANPNNPTLGKQIVLPNRAVPQVNSVPEAK